jgi:glycosyltransferase involved in cell wall biosynthesis
MSTPVVGILMTVYKNDNVMAVKEAIESIVNQSYSTMQLFLGVDGPIPSELKDLLLVLEKKFNTINLVFFESNRGLANSLNDLITLILQDKAIKYIARMDSDDVAYFNRIEKQVLFFESNTKVDVCGTSCREFGAPFALEAKHLPEEHDDLIDFSIVRCPFIHPTVMFKASIFETGIRYPADTSLTEDMALWFILLERGFQFHNINEVLLDYRLNEHTVARRHGIGKAFSEFSIRFRYMVRLKRITLKNVLLVGGRLLFHILPVSMMAYAYKKVR